MQLGAYAIPSNWVNPSGKEHFVFYVGLKDIYRNNVKDTLSPGDGFAVFGTVQGNERCLGYNVVDNDLDTLNVRINAENLAEITNLKIRFWSFYSSCVRTMKYVNTNMVLQDSASFRLGTLSFYDIPQIYYPSDTLFTNETAVLPVMGVLNDSISFSGSKGLSIDQRTGAINASLTQPGSYTVLTSIDACYNGGDIQIVVQDVVDTGPQLDSALVRFKLILPTCDTKGSILFDGVVPDGTQFLLQDIDNQRNIIASSSGNFVNVRDGVYQVHINYQGDTLTYKDTFVLSGAKACGNPVLNFSDLSGTPPAIYLEKPGMVQIFNRDGKLIKTLQAPAEWNGTDQAGMDVPMGDYYLYLNERKEQTITILR